MGRRYLTAVAPLPDHILQVDFVSGARLLLDMRPYLDKIRFLPLADPQVWNSAVTNGIFVRFGNVEISHDELLSMAERGRKAPKMMNTTMYLAQTLTGVFMTPVVV